MVTIATKAQNWSIDITVGIVIFLLAFFIFYSLMNPTKQTKLQDLRNDANIIVKQVTSENLAASLVNKNELNDTKLYFLKNSSYKDLQKIFRIEGDFCIYLEDERGIIIQINNSFFGIGTPNINISGGPCNSS